MTAPLFSRLMAVQLAFCKELTDEITGIGCATEDPDIQAALKRIALRTEIFEKLAREAGGQAGRASFEFLAK